jgi:hypothetical protein
MSEDHNTILALVGTDRIQWTDAIGFSGRLAPDQVDESRRNMQTDHFLSVMCGTTT